MAEVLLDTKFWNKAFKILRPATVVAVRNIKGAGKKKLIPSSISLDLNTDANNKAGFVLKCMTQNMPSVYSRGYKIMLAKRLAIAEGIADEEVREIEQAIIQVAIKQGIVPSTVLYKGEPVILENEQQAEPKSTKAFGFVYFIRNSDIYKIGITDNLLRRLKELKPDEVLNSVRCSNYQEIEKKMHAHFKKRRIPQTEYFRLDAAEVEEAHSLMTDLANFNAR